MRYIFCRSDQSALADSKFPTESALIKLRRRAKAGIDAGSSASYSSLFSLIDRMFNRTFDIIPYVAMSTVLSVLGWFRL